MSNAAERFGDALQSIIETAEAAGASKQDLIDSLESAIENLGAREFDPFDPTKPIRFYNYETDERSRNNIFVGLIRSSLEHQQKGAGRLAPFSGCSSTRNRSNQHENGSNGRDRSGGQ